MFKMKLAGVIVQVDNIYPAVRQQCRAFLHAGGEKPAFRVNATEDECRAASVIPPYGETICLCKKICRGLLGQGVLLLHAAAIEMDGAAYLFAGRSGVGKTTHIRLWQQVFGDGVQVINGDKPLLGFHKDKLMAYGSPWQGKERLGSNMQAPVKALCFLEQSSENRLVPLPAEQALECVFHQLLLPENAAEMDRLLALLEKILMNIPCYTLYCRPDEQAVRTVWEGLKEAETC